MRMYEEADIGGTILPAETPFGGIPYVGCAATIPVGSDSYPGTVVAVSERTVEYKAKNGKIFNLPIWVDIQECLYKRTDKNGMSEMQTYVYYEGPVDVQNARRYSWRPKARKYVREGTRSNSSAAQAPGFGYRRKYWDPSF